MGSGNCTSDGTEDSRHSVQVVHPASVVGLGVLGQEWLRSTNIEFTSDECFTTTNKVEIMNISSHKPEI